MEKKIEMSTNKNFLIKESELQKLPLFKSEITGKWWYGITHYDFLNQLRTKAENHNWKLWSFKCFLTKDQTTMAATAKVDITNFELWSKDYKLTVGVVNSNSQKVSLRIYAGVSLIKEDTCIVLYEKKIGKHTVGLASKIGDKLDNVIFHLDLVIKKTFKKEFDILNRISIDDFKNRWLLTEAARRQYMPWSRVGLVDSLFKQSRKNAWELLLCFARIAKQNPPLLQMPQLLKFYKLLRDK